MKLKEYLLKSIDDQCYVKRDWMLSALSITVQSKDIEDYPYRIKVDGDYFYYYDSNEETYLKLEDCKTNRPLFVVSDTVQLTKGDLINVHSKINTTFGALLLNLYGLILPLKDKVNYLINPTISELTNVYVTRMVNDKDYKGDKDQISVSQYLNFVDYITSLEGYAELFVASVSERSLTTDPMIAKRKKELLEQYKDQLDDPIIMVKIENELTTMDKEWMKDDPVAGFYLKDKHYKETRKKMYIMLGHQTGFGKDPSIADKSLDEGWDIDKLPGMVNKLRSNSFARGAGTAKGGYGTKILLRMLQSVEVDAKDCGTQLGWIETVTKSNKNEFIGYYYIDKGVTKAITKDNFDSLVGQELMMRTPQLCKAKNHNFCSKCLGDDNSSLGKTLAPILAGITSRLMLLEMKKMHSNQLKNTTYDLKLAIS